MDKNRLHAGLIIIVPYVTAVRQRELFTAAPKHIGLRDPTNTAVEAKYPRDRIVYSECALPKARERDDLIRRFTFTQ
jgi:hypothetical protein